MLCLYMQKSQLVLSASKNFKFTAMLVNTVARNHQTSCSKGRKMQNKSWMAALSGVSTLRFCCCLECFLSVTLQSKNSHIACSQEWFANDGCFQQNKASQRHWKNWKEWSCILLDDWSGLPLKLLWTPLHFIWFIVPPLSKSLGTQC